MSERHRAWIEAVAVAVLALGLYLIGNGRTALWDRDEPRYAGCTREMREHGEWIRTTFNGEPFYHKPILIYWLMRGSTAVFGDNPFGLRFPSAVAGAATCLLVWGWGRRALGKRAGRWAGLMLATSPIMAIESKLATTDAVLTLFCVAALFALWELARERSWRMAAVFWSSLGLAILTKGPMAPALIASAAPFWWLWGGPNRGWRHLRWGPGLVVCLLIAAPWYVAINGISGGEFFRVMIGDQVIRRASMGIEDHGGFFGYYLATALVTFFPWSALVPAAIVAAWGRRQHDPVFGFLLGWVVGPWILLECARTKLLHYYLPSYPACALLAGWFLASLSTGQLALKARWARLTTLGLLRWIGLVWVAVGTAGAWWLPADLKAPSLAAAVTAGCGWIYAQSRLSRGGYERAAAALAASWAGVIVLVYGWLIPAAQPRFLTGEVGRSLAALSARTGAEPALAGFKPPGLVYLLGRPLKVLANRENWVEEARREGALAVALRPDERRRVENVPELAVEEYEVLRGFDVEKFKLQELQTVVIRPATRTVRTPLRTESPRR